MWCMEAYMGAYGCIRKHTDASGYIRVTRYWARKYVHTYILYTLHILYILYIPHDLPLYILYILYDLYILYIL